LNINISFCASGFLYFILGLFKYERAIK
jgi:hypothetical protein